MTHKPIEDNNEYISIEVKASALSRMLGGHSLHLTDIHCSCSENKRKLQYLLLKAVNNK